MEFVLSLLTLGLLITALVGTYRAMTAMHGWCSTVTGLVMELSEAMRGLVERVDVLEREVQELKNESIK